LGSPVSALLVDLLDRVLVVYNEVDDKPDEDRNQNESAYDPLLITIFII
jgi:hypothetical protein